MKKILIATANTHKLREIEQILKDFEVCCLSLKDFPSTQMPEEDGCTFAENALIKARALYSQTKIPTLSDDSGLIVDALEGRPGIYSARYAGLSCDDEANLQKVIKELKQLSPNLSKWPVYRARFVCVIAWVNGEEEKTFEGVLEGTIIPEKRGQFGFGYDPIFYLPNLLKTNAELLSEEKNKLSHRYKALCLFKSFFENKVMI